MIIEALIFRGQEGLDHALRNGVDGHEDAALASILRDE